MWESIWIAILKYFTDSKQSIGKTLGYLIIALSILILSDLIFNISTGIHQSTTLERLKEIKDLKDQYISDLEMTNYLNKLEKEIVSRQHPYKRISSFYSSLSLPISSENNTTNTQNIPQTKLSIVFIALSSSTVLIFFIFAAISSPFWSGNYSTKNILESISMAIFIALIVSLTTFLLSLIPVLYEDWVNYLIYFVFQVLILIFGLKLWDYIEEKKKTKH